MCPSWPLCYCVGHCSYLLLPQQLYINEFIVVVVVVVVVVNIAIVIIIANLELSDLL